jgi:5'-methylthioadenosine phosphorylase
MATNLIAAREVVRRVAPGLRERPVPCPDRCDRALDGAVMTAPDARDPAVAAQLRVVAGRVL